MKVRIRIIPGDRALNLHMSVRLPYEDLRAAWAVLNQALCRAWGRDRSDGDG